MRSPFLTLSLLALIATPLAAQTADDIIARYITRVGGADRIQAATSLRRTGKFIGSGGFEATVVQENKRPGMVREEFNLQGMTAINAYDGKTGWKIDPFGGKKDAESLSEDEMHSIVLDADFDEPLIGYKAKGNKAELMGTEQVEGTDVYATLRVAPWEAALGATVKAPLPVGAVEVRVPEGSQTGRKLRLKERGIPGTPPGDLYLVLEVVLPPADNAKAREVYQAMARELAFDPRESEP